MSVVTDNIISDQDNDKIIKYKDLEIESEKM